MTNVKIFLDVLFIVVYLEGMRGCKICRNRELRESVDKLIRAGYSVNSVAKTFRLAEATLRRHKKNCLYGPEKHEKDLLVKVERNKVQPKTPPAARHPLNLFGKPIPKNLYEEEAKTLIIDGSELNTDRMSSNIKYLFAHSVDVLKIAQQTEAHTLRLRAIKEARSTLELVLKASEVFLKTDGEEEWKDVYNTILGALDPYKEAKDAVVNALNKK